MYAALVQHMNLGKNDSSTLHPLLNWYLLFSSQLGQNFNPAAQINYAASAIGSYNSAASIALSSVLQSKSVSTGLLLSGSGSKPSSSLIPKGLASALNLSNNPAATSSHASDNVVSSAFAFDVNEFLSGQYKNILSVILNFLDLNSIFRIRRVCKLFYCSSYSGLIAAYQHQLFKPTANALKSINIASPISLKYIELLDCGANSSAPLDDKGFALISQLKSLKYLDCSWSHNLTDSAFKTVNKLVNLTVLILNNCLGITGAILPSISLLPRLQRLEICGCLLIREQGFNSLIDNNSITTLLMNDNPKLADLALYSVGKMLALRHLEINGCSCFTDKGLNVFFQQNKGLTTLIARNNLQLSFNVLLSAEKSSSLEVLDLSGCTAIVEDTYFTHNFVQRNRNRVKLIANKLR
jgi:hypothetical protein